jgi:small membrane protein
MIFRGILIALLVAIGWFVFLKRNRLPFHIVTMLAMLVAGAVAIVLIEYTDAFAQSIGVGTGADLIVYLLLVVILFVLLHYFAKFAEMEAKVTQLTRELAILRAEVERLAPPSTQSDTASESR